MPDITLLFGPTRTQPQEEESFDSHKAIVNSKTGSWKDVWNGSITEGGNATLSDTGKMYALVFSDAQNSSSLRAMVLFPYVGGSQTLYTSVAYGNSVTYARVAITGASLTLVRVGNSGMYLNHVYVVL